MSAKEESFLGKAPGGVPSSPPTPLLAIRDLEVKAQDGRTIIGSSSLEISEGEICLIVGMSGSGKSLLANLILGTLDLETEDLSLSGRIELFGTDLLQRRPREVGRKMGAVFQLNRIGLFDDLSVDQNLAFDASSSSRREVATRWRESLSLEDAPSQVALASGGQQQRIALARTLERRPEVLVYDEPTTGLDPRARDVTVQLIRDHHRRLTLVVTHDYEAFLPIADRVVWIDPKDRVLRDVTHLEDVARAIREAQAASATETPREQTSLWKRLRATAGETCLTADRLFGHVLAILTTLPVFLYRLHDWRMRRQLGAYLGRFLHPGTWLYVGVAGALSGLVATFFLFDRLPMKSYTEALVQDDLLVSLGFALVRIIGPLLTAILVSAKLGASITATVGNMKYSRQTDALRLFDVNPRDYLLWPIALAFLIGTLALVAAATLCAALASLTVFIYFHLDLTPLYWWRHFTEPVTWANLGWVVKKTVPSALGTAILAYDSGMTPKRSGDDVGHAIHRTILWSLMWVLIVHAAFAFVEY